MNRRNFIAGLGLGIISISSLKSYGEVNDNWIPIMIADTENENGRIYPLTVVTNIRDQVQRLIDKKLCFASLCSDVETLTEIVNLNSVAGLIEGVKLENGTLYVKWSLLKTPCGETVKNYGQNLYMVSSGMGEMNNGIVCDNYEFIQFIISTDSSWNEHFKQKLV